MQVRDRTGDTGCGQIVGGRVAGHFAEIVRRPGQPGPTIQWVHSYVTDDKIYCVYIAQNEKQVREHARQGGFPANRVSEVRAMKPDDGRVRRRRGSNPAFRL